MSSAVGVSGIGRSICKLFVRYYNNNNIFLCVLFSPVGAHGPLHKKVKMRHHTYHFAGSVTTLNLKTPNYLKQRSQRFHLHYPGIRIIPHLEKSKLNLNLVDDASTLDIIPWKLSIPVVCFDLTSFKKDTTNLEMYKQLYLQLISEYPLSAKKKLPTVLKQRTELLRRLYQLNELINLLPVGFQMTVQYIQQS